MDNNQDNLLRDYNTISLLSRVSVSKRTEKTMLALDYLKSKLLTNELYILVDDIISGNLNNKLANMYLDWAKNIRK